MVFSLAAAVGKPLQVDLATKNQTRPSYARVKVEVDLLSEFPKCINVGVKKKTGELLRDVSTLTMIISLNTAITARSRDTVTNSVMFSTQSYIHKRRTRRNRRKHQSRKRTRRVPLPKEMNRSGNIRGGKARTKKSRK